MIICSELTEVKEHDRLVTEQAKRAQEDVSVVLQLSNVKNFVFFSIWNC